MSEGVDSRDQANQILDTSPFQHRLKTNYTPTSDEVLQLKTIVNEQKAEIGRTTQQIETLRQEIVRLCRESAPRTAFVQEHEALLAPIRQLPVDLLREIFYHCVSDGMVGSMHKDDAPMVLARVCRPWREVALSTPQLWSSIHIAVPRALQPHSPQTVRAERRILGIQEWLTRSAQTPLHLSVYQVENFLPSPHWGTPPGFDSYVDDSNADQRNMERIVDIVRPSIHRCKTLHLVCPLMSAQLFFDIPGSEWTSLGEISFQSNAHGYVGSARAPNQLSEPGQGPFYGPRLSMVTLCRIPHSHNPFLYPLPWERITHLCISGGMAYSSPMQYFDLLRSVQDTIESLQLLINPLHSAYRTFSYTRNGMPTIDVIVLPRLKRLVVKEAYAPFTLLAKTIRCPSLEELEYDEVQSPWIYSPPPSPPAIDTSGTSTQGSSQAWVGDPVGSLITLLSHSGVFLKSIAFNHFHYTNKELLEIFASIPLVRTISHLGSYVVSHPPLPPQSGNAHTTMTTAKDVLRAFVTTGDRGSDEFPYCPLLKKLAWGGGLVSDEDFLEFLELKQGGNLGVARLDGVAIHFAELSEGCHQRMLALLPDSNPPQVFITCNQVAQIPGLGIRDGLIHPNPTWPVVVSRF